MITTLYIVIDNGTALGAYFERWRAELHQFQVGGYYDNSVTISEVEINLPEWTFQ